MPVFGTSTVTVTAAIQQGTSLNWTVADPNGTYNKQVSTQSPITYAAGGGVKAVNEGVEQQFVIPASGAVTVNLNAGSVLGTAGSTTAPLVFPGTGGATLGLAGLNLFELIMTAGGSQTLTLTPGSSNGFAGWFSGGSGSITVNGSDSTGAGGNFRMARSDSLGWTVSGSKANLVISNNDTVNASTFTLSIAGQ